MTMPVGLALFGFAVFGCCAFAWGWHERGVFEFTRLHGKRKDAP